MSEQEGNGNRRTDDETAPADASSGSVPQLKKQPREPADALPVSPDSDQQFIRMLKQSRRDFLTIFDSVPAIIWLRDRTGSILRANQSAAESVGCGVRELIGKNYYQLVPDDAELSRPRDIEVIDSGSPLQNQLRQCTLQDGQIRWLTEDRFPLRDKADAVIGVMVFAQDVTEKKLAEERLIQANRQIALRNEQLRRAAEQSEHLARQASRSNLAKSEILASSSHDLRTPMNAIIGFAELLQETPLNDEQTEYIRTIHTSATGLLSLINDILDFTRMEVGKLKIRIVSCRLPAFIQEIRSMMEPGMLRKKLTFTVEIDPSLPEILYTDPLRLRQCLINLLGNAMKFTESGSVTLKVLPHQQGGAPGIRFVVEDTGIGISPDKQRHIFRSWSQAEDATERRYGGTGLGLTITQKLVELLGGCITVTSRPNQGSVFSIVLPLVETPPEAGVDPDAEGTSATMDPVPETFADAADGRIAEVIETLSSVPAFQDNPKYRQKVNDLKNCFEAASSENRMNELLAQLEQICREVQNACH
jgi:PAS domain S-box-containing protein